MTGRFEGKTCLITGAASGIGRATAMKMASQGARLALADINHDGLDRTNTLCGGGHFFLAFDVGNSITCDRFVLTAVKNLERLDFVSVTNNHGEDDKSHSPHWWRVFNCAGVNPTSYALTATTDGYFDRLMNTNVRGTYNITRASIPHLEHTGGSIVNVSSKMGLTAAKNHAIYCATKFAIVGFTKAMALELGPKGIRCNAVAPGHIDTPSNSAVVAGPEAVQAEVEQVALGRIGSAEEVADVVAFLFSEEARYMNGSIVEINGGRA